MHTNNSLKIAAFFDLDNTIITGTNSLLLYVRYLVRHKMISRFHLLKGLIQSALHKLDLVDVEGVLDKFTMSYKGKSEEELKQIAGAWFSKEVVPIIASEAKKRIDWHKKQGHVTTILSSATQYVCEPVRNYLNLDATINTEVLVKDGQFTGYLKKPLCYHDGKILYSEDFAKKNHVDLAQSYFYTDSITDLPMLEKVGHPVVINPDPLLKRHATKTGWPIELWDETNA
jgi:HAD superfamily hydrolase (TIGR01490 family)